MQKCNPWTVLFFAFVFAALLLNIILSPKKKERLAYSSKRVIRKITGKYVTDLSEKITGKDLRVQKMFSCEQRFSLKMTPEIIFF